MIVYRQFAPPEVPQTFWPRTKTSTSMSPSGQPGCVWHVWGNRKFQALMPMRSAPPLPRVIGAVCRVFHQSLRPQQSPSHRQVRRSNPQLRQRPQPAKPNGGDHLAGCMLAQQAHPRRRPSQRQQEVFRLRKSHGFALCSRILMSRSGTSTCQHIRAAVCCLPNVA